MRMGAIFGVLVAAIAVPSFAQDAVKLDSAVYIERMGHTNDGRITRTIQPASRLIRGDKVVLLLEWRTGRDGRPFAVTSPIPGTLAFKGSGRDGVEVSVDGGRSWGELGDLKVREGGTIRLASAADVTHVRWQISSRESAQGSGRIAYSAIVR